VDAKRVAELRRSGKVVYPEDIGIRRSDAPVPCSPPAALPIWWNGPTVCTTHLQIPELVMKLSDSAGLQPRRWRDARDCLIDEARLSPKPGLVDSRGNGAHHDLSLR
jgi:hypothetical protein